MLGTGKQEAEQKLLLLMFLQKDKYEKWLFRILIVLSELLVRKRHIPSFLLVRVVVECCFCSMRFEGERTPRTDAVDALGAFFWLAVPSCVDDGR